MTDGNLAQSMEFPAPDPLETNLAAEKQVQLPRKRAFRSACPPGHCFHQPVLFGEPVHDQAGICQPGEADERGQSRLHRVILEETETIAMEKRSKKS